MHSLVDDTECEGKAEVDYLIDGSLVLCGLKGPNSGPPGKNWLMTWYFQLRGNLS